MCFIIMSFASYATCNWMQASGDSDVQQLRFWDLRFYLDFTPRGNDGGTFGFVSRGVESSQTLPMFVRLRELAIAAVVALLCAPGAIGQTATPVTAQKSARPAMKAKRGSKPTAAKPETAPEPVQQQPPAPPAPQRPYEMAPVPPQVTFERGQLTINAPNSSLADILNAVRQQTGTHVEFPSSANQERVAVQIGPGNPRDVLTELLNGSPFDYVLLGSDQDPTAVTQMIVTRRQPTGTAVATKSTNPAPAQPEPSSDDEDNETGQAAETPAPAPARPAGIGQPVPGQPVNRAQPLPGSAQPIGQPVPMANNPDQNAPQPAEPGTVQPPQNGPKTPEQLLQELQRMQRQEQQKQQQPPKPPPL